MSDDLDRCQELLDGMISRSRRRNSVPWSELGPGRRARRRREHRGVSLRWFAEQLGCTHVQLSRWEREVDPIPEDMRVMLEQCLELEDGELLPVGERDG